MGLYKIRFRSLVHKELEKIPQKDQIRILKRIESLAINPRPRGYKKLAGQDRYRVQQGDYRIIYEIHDSELIVWVVTVGNRRDVYRVSEEKEEFITDDSKGKNNRATHI